MNLLFLCPHGAAKSLIAAALANDVAQRGDLPISAANAGTVPDPANNPLATAALDDRGLAYAAGPRLVQAADIEGADVVVGLGVAPADLPAVPGQFIDWADAPGVSEDVEGLIELLKGRISELVREVRP